MSRRQPLAPPTARAQAWPLAVGGTFAVALAVAQAWTLAVASPARADTPPNVWDVAADPLVAERWALHVRVQRLLHPPPPDDPVGPPRATQLRDEELHCEAALAMLEQAGAASSPDVRLRIDLGEVQYLLGDLRGQPAFYEKAATTLTAAVALAPEGPLVTEALERIVYAYARLDRPQLELDAWHRYIPRVLDPRVRASAQMNMGEAEMRLGLVDDALATFREVLRASAELPNTSSTYLLGLWDLAVALDRSGDARGALETAARACRQTAVDSSGMLRLGRNLLKDDPLVFFVPDWEKNWYLALGAEATAQGERDPREALRYYTEAEHEWQQYVRGATVALADPSLATTLGKPAVAAIGAYLRIAELRAGRVHAERAAVLKRLPAGAGDDRSGEDE